MNSLYQKMQLTFLKVLVKKNELSAATAIVTMCSKMSTQAIISITRTLSSLVRVKMIKDILKEDAVDKYIDN